MIPAATEAGVRPAGEVAAKSLFNGDQQFAEAASDEFRRKRKLTIRRDISITIPLSDFPFFGLFDILPFSLLQPTRLRYKTPRLPRR
jgi:hypothetical protein